MSLIDDLLITIDDKPGITREEVVAIADQPKVKKTAIFSGIARLQSRGFVKQNGAGLLVTSSGKQRIDFFLDGLVEFKKNKKNWYLILIEISEQHKLLRERLRYEFKKIGVGAIKKGVFLVYLSDSNIISATLNKLGLSNNAFVLSLEPMPPDYAHKIVLKAWRWDILNSEYQDFINQNKDFLRNFANHSVTLKRIAAKKAVFQFAKLLLKDPRIDDQFAPANYRRIKAFKLYSQIQPFCYV